MSKEKGFSQKVGSAIISIIFIICTLLSMTVVVQKLAGYDPSVFGYRFFIILTDSMGDTIPRDSIIIVKAQNEYQKRDIITFVAQSGAIKGSPNTHRIVDIKIENGVKKYLTQGDANNEPDGDWIDSSVVFGRVVTSFEGGTIKDVVTFVKQPSGFFVVVLVPVFVIAVLLMRSFAKEYRLALREKAKADFEAEQARKNASENNDAENITGDGK